MIEVRKTRKPYKKKLKARTRTRTKPRKLRTQRRSRKNKKYAKKYLGGLYTASQGKIGNCNAHAIARCIYRICKEYKVIPGINTPTPATINSTDYDKGIEKNQNIVYFTLLPIITYFVYIIHDGKEYTITMKLSNAGTHEYNTVDNISCLFNDKFAIKDKDKDKVLNNEEYFKNFNQYLKTYSEIKYDDLNDTQLLNKQLNDFNALTANLRNQLEGKRIHYKQYNVDDYVNEPTKYGFLKVKGTENMQAVFKEKISESKGHSVAITNVVKNGDNEVEITYKNSWCKKFGDNGNETSIIPKNDIDDPNKNREDFMKVNEDLINETKTKKEELKKYWDVKLNKLRSDFDAKKEEHRKTTQEYDLKYDEYVKTKNNINENRKIFENDRLQRIQYVTELDKVNAEIDEYNKAQKINVEKQNDIVNRESKLQEQIDGFDKNMEEKNGELKILMTLQKTLKKKNETLQNTSETLQNTLNELKIRIEEKANENVEQEILKNLKEKEKGLLKTNENTIRLFGFTVVVTENQKI